MTFDQYTLKLDRLQAMIWIDEERLVDQLHCIRHLDLPSNQQRFARFEVSSTYRRAVENIVHGLRTGEITTGPFG